MATFNETWPPKIAEPMTWENEGGTVPNITENKPVAMNIEKIGRERRSIRRQPGMQPPPRLGR